MQVLKLDDRLINVIVKSTRDGLSMAGLKPVPVGASRYLHNLHAISAIVGFAGATSGSMMVNTSEKCACFMAGSMVKEDYPTMSNAVLDGICEIANIIAGQTKALLSTTEHKFERISVPSVVVGTSYYISHYKGMTSLSVEFELPERQDSPLAEYNFTVSICMMKV